MKAVTSTILWLAIFSSTLFGQTSLTGKIVDAESGEELIAANVTLYQNGVLIAGVATDFEGNYSITLNPGIWDIEVSYVGYQTCRITGVVVAPGRINQLSISLGNGGGRQVSQPFNGNRQGQYRQTYSTTVAFHCPPTEDVVIELLENEPKKEE